MKPIFLPLLDNGSGQVMASFVMDYTAAFRDREVYIIRASDSHADRGMNKIANAFLDSPCDIWINIDADIRFTKENIDQLISHDLPLVYGLYPKKQDDCPPCVCTFDKVPVTDERGLAVVRRAGRGFMLVDRRVLEAMKEENGGAALRYDNHGKVEWDFFPSGVVTGEFSCYGDEYANVDMGNGVAFHRPKREWISEDWLFCEHARKLGFPTYVDTAIALGHVGQKEYRFGGSQLSHAEGWRSIPGWFTDQDAEIYRKIAEFIPVDGKIAEIGTWLGRSLAAFIEFCQELKKTPLIHAVDTFKGTLSEGEVHTETVKEFGGSIRQAFENNIRSIQDLGDRLIIHENDSLSAAKEIADSSLDAVFIDGDHTEEAVYADLCAWASKVKRGGILAGHDADYETVKRALRRFFGDQEWETVGRCWMVKW